MRATFPMLFLTVIAACVQAPPNPDAFRADRETALTQGVQTPSEAAQIAAETRAVLGRPSAPVGTEVIGVGSPGPTPVAAADLDRNNPSISREQDFDAVAQRRGIEADAERLRAARAQFEVIAPTELQRPQDDAPNVIAYALDRAQPRGAAGTFGRSALASERRAQGRCAGYATADLAQEAFLARGGPERDRLGLDPDGDGNACGWDPATYRSLVRR